MKKLYALFFCCIILFTTHINVKAEQFFETQQKYFSISKEEIAKELKIKEIDKDILKNKIDLDINGKKIPTNVFYKFEKNKLKMVLLTLTGDIPTSTYNMLKWHFLKEYKNPTKADYIMDDKNGFFYEWKKNEYVIQLLSYNDGNLGIIFGKEEKTDKVDKYEFSPILLGFEEKFITGVNDRIKKRNIETYANLEMIKNSNKKYLSAHYKLKKIPISLKSAIDETKEVVKFMVLELIENGIDPSKEKINVSLLLYFPEIGVTGKKLMRIFGEAEYDHEKDVITWTNVKDLY